MLVVKNGAATGHGTLKLTVFQEKIDRITGFYMLI